MPGTVLSLNFLSCTSVIGATGHLHAVIQARSTGLAVDAVFLKRRNF
jgi:hypothetical protein